MDYQKKLRNYSKTRVNYINNTLKIADRNKTNDITVKISNSKKNYFDDLAKKLCDPTLNPNSYWGIIKSFTSRKKIPIRPPLLIDDHFGTNFNEKANHFNNFFANQ